MCSLLRFVNGQVCRWASQWSGVLCTTGNQQRVTCDVCSAQSYLGTRWKCCECYDYDLCDECYHGDMHDVTHRFRRFDLATSEGFVTANSFALYSLLSVL